MTTPLCPCGAPTKRAGRKFCSRTCAGKRGGGKTPPSTECVACQADLTVDENVYVYKSGPREGRRRCRRCCLASRGTGRKPRARTARPVLAPVVVDEPPRWRPPGWAPVPAFRSRRTGS